MRIIGALIFGLCSLALAASDLNQAYQEGNQVANGHANQSVDLLKSLDVAQFPGFEPNLPQEQYYQGVTQQGTQLESDAQKVQSTNEASVAVKESFNQLPYYQINTNSENMQRLNQIAEHGDDIMRGNTTDKTTCSLKPQQCQYLWQEKTCLTSKNSGPLSCSQKLNINLVPYKTESYNLYLRGNLMNRPYSIRVNLPKTNTCKQGVSPCYTIYKDAKEAPPIQLPTDCAMIKISLVDNKGYVLVKETATCANHSLLLSVGKCILGYCQVPYAHTVTLTLEIYRGEESWDNQCISLENKEKEGFCHIKEALTCTEPNETRVIGDIPYTRLCWKKKAVYECGSQKVDSCQLLIDQRCEQTHSTCIEEASAQCVTYQQSYQCPMNQCTDNQLICGNDAFCLDGNCSSHEYSPSDETDFKKAMSALSAASEASKDFDGKSQFIFKGQMLECSDDIAGIKNCCRDSGWGIDLNLMHCSDSEKQLGKAKENKLVVATGKYCKKRVKFPGGSICTSTHKTYCVFQSKLARIVQEQGRRNQLHIGFGSGKHSNCSGITPEQLQLIHFESIDFSEFYQDIQNKQKQPDYQQTTSGISKRLQEFYQQGDVNA